VEYAREDEMKKKAKEFKVWICEFISCAVVIPAKGRPPAKCPKCRRVGWNNLQKNGFIVS
jgi:rubrerythrin